MAVDYQAVFRAKRTEAKGTVRLGQLNRSREHWRKRLQTNDGLARARLKEIGFERRDLRRRVTEAVQVLRQAARQW